jgi:hypothetical protein
VTHPAPYVDPLHVEARRVLLDALEALTPHGRAVILVGAQAIYVRTSYTDIAIAPFTTDGDLVLDPSLLGPEPRLEAAMRSAGFELRLPDGDHPEPGIWVMTVNVGGDDVEVPVDLIVPEGAATGGGRRGARLGPHGKRAARRVPGLEPALVDHSRETVRALDRSDPRALSLEVAGPAALLVAKAHKLRDRVESPRRVDDKDAVDVYRLMQATSPRDVRATIAGLSEHELAGAPTRAALVYLRDLFARRNGAGIQMAARALRLAVPAATVRTLCMSYTEELLSN